MSGSAPAARYRGGGYARHSCDRSESCVPTSSPLVPPSNPPSSLTPGRASSLWPVRADADIGIGRKGHAAGPRPTIVPRSKAILRDLSRIEAEEVADEIRSLGADGAELVGESSSTIKLREKISFRHIKLFQPSEQWRAEERVRGFPSDCVDLAPLFRPV